jgi:dTDP-glucose pyrophosphorylase
MENTNRVINESVSIRSAVKMLDTESLDTLIVLGSDKVVLGVFTMGDFRRSVLTGIDINNNIKTLIHEKYIYLIEGFVREDITSIFNENPMIQGVPVVNKKHHLVKYIERGSYAEVSNVALLDKGVDVVIMAGGKGTRLDPFTRILPKPLIPIGNNPIVKVIMDEFSAQGVNRFFLSVNEKSRMIKAYFYDHNLSYKLKYIEEDRPLGTAGSLSYFSGTIKNNLIVSNCDILVKTCYVSMMNFHKDRDYDITIVSSIRHYKIPYGVCILDNSGEFETIQEKPENTYLVNTGMYILKSTVLDLIPKNQYFDMTDLILAAKSKGLKVGTYPISEESWLDVGQWKEYKDTVKMFTE